MKMRMNGSGRAFLVCLACQEESSKFRVYFSKDSGGNDVCNSSAIPEGWFVEEEAIMENGVIYGYCPGHKEKSNG